MKVTVLVRPKDGILDPQGEAVAHALQQLGFPAASARLGRVIDLELDVDSAEEAERLARDAADQVLANALIERFDIVATDPVGAP
jgi:phosphoribosylformylglycinamidine synthase PurS subunit